MKQKREQLGVQKGDKIILKGTVAFARLDKLVDGADLDRENQRRTQMGMIPTKAFRSVTIENPEIVQGQGTPLAKFHEQEVYQSKGSGKPTMNFESKSLFPPSFGHIQPNGAIQEIPDPQKNPAQGQVVYLMISAYQTKSHSNLGSTFDAVVYEQGEIKFYESKSNSLAGFGQAMNMPVEPMAPQQDLVGAGVNQQGGFGQQEQAGFNQQQNFGQQNQGNGNQQGGFGQVPAGDPNQGNGNQNGFGGFGQGQEQGQNGFGQSQPQGDQASNGNDPFGLQGGSGDSPFGNNGQRTTSPYA